MFLNTFIFGISASIDALGVGINYGIKKTKILLPAFIVLFIISSIMSGLSVFLGNIISSFVSDKFVNILGAFFLILIGLFIIYGALAKEKKNNLKEYNFFIKFLGITIKIIKKPVLLDIDNSHSIDLKESILLSLILSLDVVSIGIGAGASDINHFLFPVFVGVFQILFLFIGKLLGKNMTNISKVPENIWSVLSGILLILMGVFKLI